jgi:hypothetical protein
MLFVEDEGIGQVDNENSKASKGRAEEKTGK